MSFTFPLGPAERDKLLKFGLLVESAAGFPDMKLTELVDYLLSPDHNVNLTKLLDIDNAELKRSLPDLALRPIALSLLKSEILDKASHDRHGHLEWKVLTALTTLAVVAVVLRLISRKQTRSRLAIEEWLIILSIVLVVAYAITVGVGFGFIGAGWHIYDMSFHLMKENLKLVYAAELTYDFAILFIRTSLLVFYYSLCPDYSFHISIAVVFVLNLLLSLARVFFNAFSCRPFNFWDHPIERVCVKNAATWMITFACLNVVVDCMVLLLPAKVVWKLPLSMRERFAVLGIFGVGAMAMVGSITRIFTLEPFLHSVDRTWYQTPLGVWSLVEMDLAIIATCIPALRHLVKRYWPRFLEQPVVRHVRRKSASISDRGRKSKNWFNKTFSSTGTSTLGTMRTTNTSATRAGTVVDNDEQAEQNNNARISVGRGGLLSNNRERPSGESQIGIATVDRDGDYSQFELDEFIDDRVSEKDKHDIERNAGASSGAVVSGDQASDRSGNGSAVASSGVGAEDQLDDSSSEIQRVPTTQGLGQRHRRDDSKGSAVPGT